MLVWRTGTYMGFIFICTFLFLFHTSIYNIRSLFTMLDYYYFVPESSFVQLQVSVSVTEH